MWRTRPGGIKIVLWALWTMSAKSWYVKKKSANEGWHTDGLPQGRNTGVKAIFGNSVKKPLMTKVSMRHLNEIVRERNQYSRDAMEAWQDFINLKGRMDGELTKVTKRNNFLVDELESWKQQVRISLDIR